MGRSVETRYVYKYISRFFSITHYLARKKEGKPCLDSILTPIDDYMKQNPKLSFIDEAIHPRSAFIHEDMCAENGKKQS
jgi:hypothetical protein